MYNANLVTSKKIERLLVKGSISDPADKGRSTIHTSLLSPNGINNRGKTQKLLLSPDGLNNRSKTQNLLQKKTSNLVLNNDVAMRIASSLNIKDIIKTIYQESSRLVDTTNFALAIYDDQTDALAFPLVLYQGRRKKPFLVKRSHIRGLVSDTLTRQRSFRKSDLLTPAQSAPYDPIRPTHPIRSWLSVPIHIPLHPQENARGAIIVWSHQPHAFTQQQALKLSALGLPAAIAIRSVQLHQTGQRQALELAVINDIVQTLASTLQLNEVLNRIMELVEGMLKVQAGAVLLTDQATQELTFQVAIGETKTIEPFRILKGNSLASHVAWTGKKPELITKVSQANRPYLELASYLQVEPRNCLYVPLTLKEQVIGVLAVINKTEGTFTQSDLNLLTSIAVYAAIAIDNARLYESMLAERDRALTIEEQARQDLARLLHDGPTQLVSALKMRLDYCQKIWQKEPTLLEEEFEAMNEIVDDAISQMRTRLIELLPPDLTESGQGLGAAIRTFMERKQQETPKTKMVANIMSHLANDHIARQDPQVEKVLFKIMQETVNNAIKHANASYIAVHLEETPDTLRLLIEDNGQGFDYEATMTNYGKRASLGMINIQDRAEAMGSDLAINTAPGKGTRISLEVPKSKTKRLQNRGTGLLTPVDNLR